MDTLEELRNQRAELDKKIEELESAERPYKVGEKYWGLNNDGSISELTWDNYSIEKSIVKQGNAFNTKKEAGLEAERRKLLHYFKMFRDKCNGGWKADFEEFDRKYFIMFSGDSKNILISSRNEYDYFNLFGYFENESDARKAIELFGDEIKRLYVEV